MTLKEMLKLSVSTILVLFAIILLVRFFDSEPEDKYGPWISPPDNRVALLSKVILKKNIHGCGEFHVKEKINSDSEYLIACTPDGNSWMYYEIDLYNETIELYFGDLKPPY